MKTLALTQGKYAVVDDADADLLCRHKWCAQHIGRCWYAARRFKKAEGKRTVCFMHRYLLEVKDRGVEVNHINGDGLDNRRINLEICDHAQQQQAFQRKRRGCYSRFRGVTWHKLRRKWAARIQVKRRSIHLGLFVSEEEAARVRDAAALKFFGPHAHLNFL